VLLRIRPGTTEQAVSSRITVLPGVIKYLSTATVADAIREAFGLYDTLVGLMLAFAALMAAALLFNAMLVNVAERAVELGTLQAAGMAPRMQSRLVATENLLLAVLGLPLGLGAGLLVASWFMSTYETEGYRWGLDMRLGTPFVVVGFVLLAAILAQLPALRAIRRVDIAKTVRERSL